MVITEDKKMVGDMYELNEAIEYLNGRYNSDGTSVILVSYT